MLYSKNSGSQDQFKTTVIDTMVAEIQSVPGEYKEQMEEMFQVRWATANGIKQFHPSCTPFSNSFFHNWQFSTAQTTV